MSNWRKAAALKILIALTLLISGCSAGEEKNTNEDITKNGMLEKEEAVVEKTGYRDNSYFVAITGSDENPGTEDKPFRTIQKAADIMVPGDICIIREGTYRESVRQYNSGDPGKPISFVSYPGEKVTVSGAQALELEWEIYEDSIYKAKVSWSFNQLFVNGRMMNEARWPNAEIDRLIYMPRAKTKRGTDGKILKDTSLPKAELDGARLNVWPGEQWVGYSKKVKNYVGGKQFEYDVPFGNTIGDPVGYDPFLPKEGNSYYLSGKLDLLDSLGEWFLDNENGILYLWAPDGKSPEGHMVEAKKNKYAFNISYKSNIIIKDIDIFASAINMEQSHNCIIDNVHLKYVEHFTGIDGYKTSDKEKTSIVTGSGNKWCNSSILFSAGNGLAVGGKDNIIENCIILGVNYIGGYFANIYLERNSSGTVIRNNTLGDSGRFIIYHSNAEKVKIKNNIMYNSSTITIDCGSTYAWGTDGKNSEISYNWIFNGGYAGIYLDNFCSNFKIHHNVVWSNKIGIILNSDSLNNDVVNNTVVRNGKAFNVYTYPENEPNQKGTRVANNIFDGKADFVDGDNAPELKNNGEYELDTNFVPTKDSKAIDGGVVFDGITKEYSGKAPDIGAYEFEGEYWIPGADWSLD